MPIYEYRCEICDETFEVFHKISDAPLGKCPKCGKKVNRLISQTSFALKGGGWYKDGYAAKGGDTKPTADKPAAEKPKAAGGAEKKSSDPKPETKK